MLVECQGCHGAISDTAKKCPKCAAPPDKFLGAALKCRECGEDYRVAYSECGHCGALRSAAAPVSVQRRPAESEPPVIAQGEPPLIAATKPNQDAQRVKEKVGGNWGRKLLITALGIGSAAAYYTFTPNDSGTVTGHVFQSLGFGFAPFIFTYLVSWVVMSVRRKPMRGFFQRHPLVFMLPMVLIAVSSGLQLSRAQQSGDVAVDARAQQLQREIEALQAKLPTQLADGIEMTSIINGGDVVTFGFSLDANLFEPNSFSQGLEPDFRKFACSDDGTTKFLTHYSIPVVMSFRIGNHTPINVRVAPSDCR